MSQISINIAHRCLPSVSARFLFVGGAIAALVLLALSLFYLVRDSPEMKPECDHMLK